MFVKVHNIFLKKSKSTKMQSVAKNENISITLSLENFRVFLDFLKFKYV